MFDLLKTQFQMAFYSLHNERIMSSKIGNAIKFTHENGNVVFAALDVGNMYLISIQ